MRSGTGRLYVVLRAACVATRRRGEIDLLGSRQQVVGGGWWVLSTEGKPA